MARPDTRRKYLLFRMILPAAVGVALASSVPPTVLVVLLMLVGVYLIAMLLILCWPPWRRQACTICGRRPALPAPIKPVKPTPWYFPVQVGQSYEYVCADHLLTWVRMRVAMEERQS
jgi:hypothetical protein